ncbi:MAG TPA: PKD domain-containing protein [Chitinophagaceae bacterium]|nr:PKD domain-containing protein [Chitinophagaceae bacterium]
MKKQYLNIFLSLIIIITVIIFFEACKKLDNANSPSPPAPPPAPPPVMITASVAGLITDINNNPVSNANVSAGSSATTTDINGLFTIRDVQLIKDDGFVKVVKTGYFDGSRTFLVNANTINNVKIKLIPKTASGNFAAASGGLVNVTGGGAIDFSSGGIVNATTGSAYTGNVSVSIFYLNPTDPNFKEYMPGDLRGISTDNKERILRSFGMIAVEMNDAGGQKLQLAAGKTATVTIPIPSAMQSSAPASIALWYFDETSGIWKEEGSATKQTTNYVGTVKHFSFWNAGELVQDVRLDATFKNDSSGLPLVNKLVTVTSVNYGTRNSYTDNTGKVSGLVPASETLVMKVFSDCGGALYTNNIGPLSTNTDLGNINIAFSNETLVSVTVTGNAVNCSSAPVIHGSVRLTMGSDNYNAVINNGNFSLVFNRCSNAFTTPTLIAYDSITNQSGNPLTLSISGGAQNIGQISACNSFIPVANFTYSSSSPFVPDTISFINTSSNAASYLWNFGDGTTSTLVNPLHIYTTAGDFTVTLTATGSGGANSFTKIIHVFNAASDTYITLTLNGTSYSWLPPDELDASYNTDSSSSSNYYTSIRGGNTTSTPVKYILCGIYNNNTVSPGNFPFNLYTIINGTAYNTYYPNSNPQTSITEYGPAGGYVTGSASGWIKNFPVPTTDSFAFSCTYRVKRTQ